MYTHTRQSHTLDGVPNRGLSWWWWKRVERREPASRWREPKERVWRAVGWLGGGNGRGGLEARLERRARRVIKPAHSGRAGVSIQGARECFRIGGAAGRQEACVRPYEGSARGGRGREYIRVSEAREPVEKAGAGAPCGEGMRPNAALFPLPVPGASPVLRASIGQWVSIRCYTVWVGAVEWTCVVVAFAVVLGGCLAVFAVTAGCGWSGMRTRTLFSVRLAGCQRRRGRPHLRHLPSRHNVPGGASGGRCGVRLAVGGEWGPGRGA